jgi:hypothetical protein
MPRSTTIGWLFALSLGLSACTGIVEGPSTSTGGPPGSDPSSQGASNNPAGAPNQTALVVGHTPIRRLTSGELQNSDSEFG